MKSSDKKLIGYVACSLILISAASLLPVSLMKCFETRKPHATLLLFETTRLDAGSFAFDNEPRTFTFICRNNSDQTVRIETVEVDCACTSATYEKLIKARGETAISLRVTPSPNKSQFSASVHASQNGRKHVEKLSIQMQVFDSQKASVTPPTLMLGNLILDHPFLVKRNLQIVGSDGEPIVPLSISAPDWIQVDFTPTGEQLSLTLSGHLPKRFSTRGNLLLKLPHPSKDLSVDFTYTPRLRYEVCPQHLFGSIGEGASGRNVELAGVSNEIISYQITVEGSGLIDVSNDGGPAKYILTPQFNHSSEVSGKITWVIKSKDGVPITELGSSFTFLKRIEGGIN